MNVDQLKLAKLAEDIVAFKNQTQESIDKALEEVSQAAKDTNDTLAEIKRFSQKVESEFESVTNELVGILKEIKSQGLKGDKGEDADEEAIEKRLLAKIPEINVDDIVAKASSMVKPTPASLKIIKESIDLKGEEIVPKLNTAANLDELKLSIKNIKDWESKWGDIKAEISRNKGGYHGGGFNNISSSGTVVSTGLDTLNFTGAIVTQSGRTVTVAIGSGAFSTVAVTPTPDDTTLVYTAASPITAVVINGSTYINGSSAMDGTISISGTTITLPSPVGAGGDIYGIA